MSAVNCDQQFQSRAKQREDFKKTPEHNRLLSTKIYIIPNLSHSCDFSFDVVSYD